MSGATHAQKQQQSRQSCELCSLLGYHGEKMNNAEGTYQAENHASTIIHACTRCVSELFTLENFTEYDPTVEWNLPSLDEINEAVEERDITKSNFSYSIGFDSSGSFSHALTAESISREKLQNAVKAIRYYDRNGILPLPEEIQ